MKCKVCKKPLDSYVLLGKTLYTSYGLDTSHNGGLCLSCYDKTLRNKPLEKPDFIKTINI